VQINAVVQAALRVPDPNGVIFPGDDKSVRALDPQFDGTYSKVEVIWQLANYFKHQEQWNSDMWVNPTRSARWTIPVITLVGLSCGGSSSNLRIGAEALGNTAYSDVNVFSQIVRDWSTNVRNHVRAAVGR
jgi:hypothetical protein